MEPLAFIGDFAAAKAAWEQYKLSKPNERLTWRHGARVVQEQPCGQVRETGIGCDLRAP